MTIKRKFAYYIIPIILVCVVALFVFMAKYENNQQESSNMDRYPPLEETKVVGESEQKQTEDRRDTPVADTNKDATDATEVVIPDDAIKDVDSSATVVETPIDEDAQQTASPDVADNEVWDSEAREIPNLSDVHLLRPHYTKVLDNGTVFDSRNSQEVVIPAGAVTSGSIDDVKSTIHALEKIENKSPGLRAYIETLKRVEHP